MTKIINFIKKHKIKIYSIIISIIIFYISPTLYVNLLGFLIMIYWFFRINYSKDIAQIMVYRKRRIEELKDMKIVRVLIHKQEKVEILKWAIICAIWMLLMTFYMALSSSYILSVWLQN